MDRSCQSKCVLAFSTALSCAGCSLNDFGYLSDDFAKAGSGTLGGSAGSAAGAGADASAGSGAGSGASGGSSGQGGSEPVAGGGAAGNGSGIENQFFCMPEHAVFGADGAAPPVDLPPTGNYIVHKEATAAVCLLSPDWPALGDKRYWAITHECGGPGSSSTPGPGEVWHLEHLCSDVYRFTSNHDTSDERQLALVDFDSVGAPLYSVPSQRSIDPTMLFHLRFEELVGQAVRWRFSPAIQASSCVEQSGTTRYGEVDVTRVVLFPCTGNLANQSWNLLPLP